ACPFFAAKHGRHQIEAPDSSLLTKFVTIDVVSCTIIAQDPTCLGITITQGLYTQAGKAFQQVLPFRVNLSLGGKGLIDKILPVRVHQNISIYAFDITIRHSSSSTANTNHPKDLPAL